MSLPAADDLFRPTVPGQQEADPAPVPVAPAPRSVSSVPAPEEADHAQPDAGRKPSGRVRHDEKVTVYVTSDELLEIEHARLTLRREHGLAVDRGRLVREAVALVLAELEELGSESRLVRRLSEE